MQKELKTMEHCAVPVHKAVICCMCKRKMNMKRSRSLSPEPSSSDDPKRTKVEDDLNNAITHPYILDFSDDVLLNILKFLRPQDLMAVSMCCQRLGQVAQDRTLWRKVDFRESPIYKEELCRYFKFLQPVTMSLAIRGKFNGVFDSELSYDVFDAIRTSCDQLKELMIEEFFINPAKIRITDFPRTIEKLSLKGCDLGCSFSEKSYFFKMDLHMPNLTCLILSNCKWFAPHSLLVISKVPKLKELRLDSCHLLGECVAYASLATRFGFKMLEVLDLRDTAVGDSEVGCFSSTRTLTHLYLECPVSLRNEQVTERPSLHPEQMLALIRGQLDAQRRAGIIYQDGNLVEFVADDEFPLENYALQRCLISDRAICALGSDDCDRCSRRIINNSPHGVLVVEEDKRIFNNPHLKTLVVRHYPRVTNVSLEHLAMNASSLEYLDVTGTSVTRLGVENFKLQKPHVKIVSSFDET